MFCDFCSLYISIFFIKKPFILRKKIFSGMEMMLLEQMLFMEKLLSKKL